MFLVTSWFFSLLWKECESHCAPVFSFLDERIRKKPRSPMCVRAIGQVQNNEWIFDEVRSGFSRFHWPAERASPNHLWAHQWSKDKETGGTLILFQECLIDGKLLVHLMKSSSRSWRWLQKAGQFEAVLVEVVAVGVVATAVDVVAAAEGMVVAVADVGDGSSSTHDDGGNSSNCSWWRKIWWMLEDYALV